MAEPELVIDCAVCVVESPGEDDVLEGRSEGEALSAALHLAEITTHYFQVVSRKTLKDSFNLIASKVRGKIVEDGQKARKIITLPTIHFSCHGDEAGIYLTNGDAISWAELRMYLIDFGNSINHVDNDTGILILSFSSCKGAWASEMFSYGKPYPCVGIIGPKEDVSWVDSLVAYLVLYNLNIGRDDHERVKIKEAVECMNQAVRLNGVFVCHECDDPKWT